MKRFPLLCGLCLFLIPALVSEAGERVALVIGNNIYQPEKPAGERPNLANAVADAEAVKAMLVGKLGFKADDVLFGRDLTRVQIHEQLEKFRTMAAGAEVAIIFYAGHGMESLDGTANFMIPVDADVASVAESDARLRAAGIDIGAELQLLGRAAPGAAKVALMDCCRERPAGRNLGAVRGGGMVQLREDAIPAGTLIMLAAAPGRLASDGALRHGPFTQALLETLPIPGQTMLDGFYKVSDKLEELTRKQQVPWLKTDGSARVFRELVLLRGNNTPGSVPVPDDYALYAGKEAGERKLVEVAPGVSIAFRWCPPGSFTMGSPETEEDRDDDEDQVTVRITKGYWLARTETTQAQWRAVMGTDPSKFKGADLPVETVSWDDAQAFIGKLNAAGGLPAGWKWALPTEAQWEYACRAGTKTAFSFGNSLNGREANVDGNYPYGTATKGPYLEKTQTVGSYAANGWGLHDMHGNVWEWCGDWYSKALGGGADPVGSLTGVRRVCRGGSWFDLAAGGRAAYRGNREPGVRNYDLGFRPALVPSR